MGKQTPTEVVLEPNSPAKVEAKMSKKKSKPTEQSAEITITEGDVQALPAEESQTKLLKKKLRASRTVQPVEEAPLAPEEPVKKGKKRKHRVDNPGAQEKDSAAVIQEEPPKKKHKNRTEFPDPRDDATLNNQSRKALEYIFTQMNKPSKWKFNKARQNWLIRNIWAPESLPDTYLPLVVKYIANVQGGSREKLKETCQTYLKVPEVETPADKDTPSVATPSGVPKSILKATTSTTAPSTKPTSGPLIAGPLIDTSKTPIPVAGPTPEALLANIRRSRAETLLEALNSEPISDSMET